MFKLRYLLLILAIAFLGFFLSLKNLLLPVRNLIWQGLSQVSLTANTLAQNCGGFFRSVVQIKNLEIENKQLKSENLEINSQLSHLQDVERENEILNLQLGFAQKMQLQFIPSQIIGHNSYSYSSLLTVNKGQSDGVAQGAAALSSGFLIGQVAKTSKSISDVLGIVDGNSKIPVVLSKSRGTGILQGGLDGLTIQDITLDTPVEKDEDVLTSGLGGQLPAGIPIGKVSEILPSSGEIFKKVKVSSPISFGQLEIIFIVKNNE